MQALAAPSLVHMCIQRSRAPVHEYPCPALINLYALKDFTIYCVVQVVIFHNSITLGI